MKAGRFISLVSGAYGVDENSVKLFARNLREAGYMTTGARGKNSPDMVPDDLMVITIALLATEAPSKAVEEYRYFSSLQPCHEEFIEGANPELFGPDHTLRDIMSHICNPKAEIPSGTEVTFHGTRDASINFEGKQAIYHSREDLKRLSEILEKSEEQYGTTVLLGDHGEKYRELVTTSPAFHVTGIQVSRSIEVRQINLLKKLLFGEFNWDQMNTNTEGINEEN